MKCDIIFTQSDAKLVIFLELRKEFAGNHQNLM
jgi:hypothetical protein